MNHEIKKLEKSEIEIIITVPEEDFEKYRKKACEDISKNVNAKGFRPGHIPHHVLEQFVEKEYIEAHTQELAIQRSYADAVIKEKLQVISKPKIEIESKSPFKYKATVAVMPEVELKDYKSIKIDKKEVKVVEKDIEDVLEDMKKHGTTYKEADRAAKKGDRAEVDFEGFDSKGKEVEGTKSQNHPVVLGENTLIPGFEEELIGLKKDEKKEFDIKFPKDYHKKEYSEKKVKFKVHIKKIEEPIAPEINEELIEKMTGKKKKIDEFKKEIKENIKARKETEEKNRRENEYVEALIKKLKVELPNSLVDEETGHILADMKDEIGQKGLEFDKFLEQAKTTEDDLKKKYRPEAEKRIKMRLALQEVIKQEKIEISEKEIIAEFEKVKSYYPEDQQKKIEEDFKGGDLGVQIQNRLTLRKLFEKVLG